MGNHLRRKPVTTIEGITCGSGHAARSHILIDARLTLQCLLDAQALHNLNMADVITDFSPKGEGDRLDVSNLLTALVGEHPGMTEASAVASMTAAVDTATNSTKISINTGSETHVVATLQNYTPTGHDAVQVLFNNHDEQLATHTQTAGA